MRQIARAGSTRIAGEPLETGMGHDRQDALKVKQLPRLPVIKGLTAATHRSDFLDR
jgi:hypothetical protein